MSDSLDGSISRHRAYTPVLARAIHPAYDEPTTGPTYQQSSRRKPASPPAFNGKLTTRTSVYGALSQGWCSLAECNGDITSSRYRNLRHQARGLHPTSESTALKPLRPPCLLNFGTWQVTTLLVPGLVSPAVTNLPQCCYSKT